MTKSFRKFVMNTWEQGSEIRAKKSVRIVINACAGPARYSEATVG